MNKLFTIFAFVGLFSCSQTSNIKTPKPIDAGLAAADTWFRAWELVAKETYKMEALSPVELVLFDEKYVYTTSERTGAGGEIIEGPKMFDRPFVWYKKLHNGQLNMPDCTKKEVDIMSYTAPLFNKEDTLAFFVTPLPSYWQLKDIGDHGIGYDSLALIVFLHEFTHSQQIIKSHDGMDGIINGYLEKHPNDGQVFGDDMMQSLFEKDVNYTKAFQAELDMFYAACAEPNEAKQRNMIIKAIALMEKRHNYILTKDKKDLAEIDKYWLTMEGLGQYSTYAWLINPKGGNMSYEKALPVLKTKWWSQEEGFPICYLLAKYGGTQNWHKTMFCRNPTTTIGLLKAALIRIKKK